MAGPFSANVLHTRVPSCGTRLFWALLLVGRSVRSAAAGLRSGAELGQARANAATQVVAQLQVGPPSKSESMAYLLSTLEKFKAFAEGSRRGVEERHRMEEARLHSAIGASHDPAVQLALEQSATSNKESLMQTRRVYDNMLNFSESVSSLLKAATSSGVGCEQKACGEHASCTETTGGAECVCNEGYVGLGQVCSAPPEFLPHRLIYTGTGGGSTRAADMNVCVFGANKIAVVFRDLSQAHSGQVVVGSVREAGTADLTPPEQFTTPGGKAFSPVVTGTTSKRIAIAWRDANRMGSCWVRGAELGASGILGADMAITWGQTVNFCQDQAHKMASVSLPNNLVAILFSDRARGGHSTSVESFGNSLLASLGPGGKISVLGKFRFSDYGVCRLEVTKVTPTAFVVAARGAIAVDDLDPSIHTKQEAMAMYGELIDNDLVFDPNPVNIEPKRSQIWARGLSLIAPNTFAYAFQDGMDMAMKMAVLEINPTSHRIEAVQGPVVLRSGFSPYVSMLSVPYTPSDPHTLIYYEDEVSNTSMVNLCSWSTTARTFGRCEDFAWLNQRLTSVSGIHLGGGKSFFVFTPESGVPYYGVFGLSKK